ncbi:TPA: hypothetical protein EYO77_03660 [Candidatus Poribacteria bacterium]|nr:hypothetical protein [Candidatus Poribacteria bacterium]
MIQGIGSGGWTYRGSARPTLQYGRRPAERGKPVESAPRDCQTTKGITEKYQIDGRSTPI